jgi:hypothetical protein
MDYAMGNHPLWQLFRVAYQITKKPYLLRGLAIGTGYLSASLRQLDRPVSGELMKFHRREQMQRLKKQFIRNTASVNNTAITRAEVHEPQ